MKIDIRDVVGNVDEIKFFDYDRSDYHANTLRKSDTLGRSFKISDFSDGECSYVTIRDRDHVNDLINALEKAKELGWV